MYVNIKDILSVANRNGFAVIACSPVDMEMARAMIRAAEEMNAPIIFLLGQNMMRRIATAELVIPMIRTMAEADGKLIIGGRLADYAYYDMDKTVKAALNKVQSVL